MGTIASLARVLAVLAIVAAASPSWSQTPPPDPDQDAATPLADIVVEGRDLDEATREFVEEVAAPARGRGLARWNSGICVGAIGLQTEAAQYLVDRVSTVAQDVGLTVGKPGCEPSVIVFATNDGQGLARSMVESRARLFDTNVTGANLSDRALVDFQTSDRLIRWWHLSLPVDSVTGRAAVAIPGQCRGDCLSVEDQPPIRFVFAASRVNSEVRDDLRKVIIVLDVDALAHATFEQISDYIAMVALAQIAADADTSGFDTILNLFDPAVATGRLLTTWDTAYLRALYRANQTEIGTRRNTRAVADAMADERSEPAPPD